MFTQSSPALVNALSGALPENVVKALTQALGNCNQPLTHRAPVNLQPANAQQSGPGYYTGGQWNPQDYQNILPTASDRSNVDIPNWEGPGGWNSGNFYGDTFQFPTSQEFTLNNYYGGPNVYGGGNSYFENLYATNQTVQNLTAQSLTVQNINGTPVVGPAGPPGARGDRGADGVPGAGGMNGINGWNGWNGLNGKDAVLPLPKKRQIMDGIKFAPITVNLSTGGTLISPTPTITLSQNSIAYVEGVTPVTATATVVTGVTFDPTTCSLTATTAELSYVESLSVATASADVVTDATLNFEPPTFSATVVPVTYVEKVEPVLSMLQYYGP